MHPWPYQAVGMQRRIKQKLPHTCELQMKAKDGYRGPPAPRVSGRRRMGVQEGNQGRDRPGEALVRDTCLKHYTCGSLGERQTGPREECGRGPKTGWSWARVRAGSGPGHRSGGTGKRLVPLAVRTLAVSSGRTHRDDKRCSIWSGLLRLPSSRKTHFSEASFQSSQVLTSEKLELYFSW